MITLDQAGRDLKRIRMLPVPPDLGPVVEYIWFESAPASPRAVCRIVPDPSGHLIFRIGPRSARGIVRVVGPRSVFTDIDKAGRQLTLGVRFRPGVLGGLFGVASSALRDTSVALESLVGADGIRLANRLTDITDARRRVDLIAAFLRGRQSRAPAVDWRVLAARRLLTREAGGSPSMRHLASETGNSQRTLRDVLKAEVGLGLKRWAQIDRVSRVLHGALERKALGESAARWAELAAAGGYADQSHLIREHRLLLGETPVQFLRRARSDD